MEKMDYTLLRRKFHERGATQRLISDQIGLSEAHFSRKLSGQFSFTQDEIRSMCRLLDIRSVEIGRYFFTTEVELSHALSEAARRRGGMERRV